MPPMLAPKETMDAEVMEISIPQFAAEMQTNDMKVGNANNVTSLFSKPMNQPLKD